MKTRTLTNGRVYKLFKDRSFREAHPEFRSAYALLDSQKRKCCGKKLKGQAFMVCIDIIKRNPDKIKKFLGVDQIEIFYGSPLRIHKL